MTLEYANGDIEFPSVEKQFSEESIDECSGGVSTDLGSRWIPDFENESRYGFESVSSEQQSSKSRRSIERDALRKYVRQRYMKRGDKSAI
jgi:hypothetical protein